MTTIKVNTPLLTSYGLTTKHISNLHKLADYLYKLPRKYGHFDMQHYCEQDHFLIEPDDAPKMINECGTSACAAGHGPMAGIHTKEYTDYWADYVQECFLGDQYGEHYGEMFDQLFDTDWAGIDNTPKGAAARIYYFLTHGLDSEVMDTFNGYNSLTLSKVLMSHMARVYNHLHELGEL